MTKRVHAAKGSGAGRNPFGVKLRGAERRKEREKLRELANRRVPRGDSVFWRTVYVYGPEIFMNSAVLATMGVVARLVMWAFNS